MNAAAQAAPAVMTLPEIGQPFAGGFFTGIYQQDGKRYAVITAPAANELEGEWGAYGENVDGARSLTDSRANTEAMAEAGSDLAKQVLALPCWNWPAKPESWQSRKARRDTPAMSASAATPASATPQPAAAWHAPSG